MHLYKASELTKQSVALIFLFVVATSTLHSFVTVVNINGKDI